MEKVFSVKLEERSGLAPPAVIVFFGANDACLPDRCSAFQHVPLDEYMLNLRSIVSLLKKRWPASHILLITPPPIDEAGRLLIVFEEVVEKLRGVGVSLESLPVDMPLISAIDPNDPLKAFEN
ncbi:hypothetical protein LguiB_005297 [Lonicera macranthoides]